MPEFNPSSINDLSGKVFLVTGGTAGIGYQTILHLVRKNAKVYMGGRSESKAKAAIASIKELVPGADIQLLILDHMNLASVVTAAKEFAGKEPRLHGLINNAGIMAVPFKMSKDGYESQWQTNYVAHWLLTHHLLPTLLATAKVSEPGEVRIANVTSMGHRYNPKGGIDFQDINQVKGGIWSRYGQSKLGNILHAKYLNSLYGPEGSQKSEGEIWTAALHPGNMYTDLNKNARFAGPLSPAIAWLLNALGSYIPVDQGAYTSAFCAASQHFQSSMSGQYFVPLGKLGKPSKKANDLKLSEQLWEWTEEDMNEKTLL